MNAADLVLTNAFTQRVTLLNTWKEYESVHGDETNQKVVEGMMPWRVTSYGQNATDGQHETCMLRPFCAQLVGLQSRPDQTWVFPDDQREKSSISTFLANAHKWRQNQAATTETAVAAPAAQAMEDDEAGSDEE